MLGARDVPQSRIAVMVRFLLHLRTTIVGLMVLGFLSWPCDARSQAVGLISAQRSVRGEAWLCNVFGPCGADSVKHVAEAFAPFSASAYASQGYASGHADQESSFGTRTIHGVGNAGTWDYQSPGGYDSGSGSGASRLEVQFHVPAPCSYAIAGSLAYWCRPETRGSREAVVVLASSAGAVMDKSLRCLGNGCPSESGPGAPFSQEGTLEVGDYVLTACALANYGKGAASFSFDLNLGCELVGVAPAEWGDVKRLYR
jgi:hypothetical protein